MSLTGSGRAIANPLFQHIRIVESAVQVRTGATLMANAFRTAIDPRESFGSHRARGFAHVNFVGGKAATFGRGCEDALGHLFLAIRPYAREACSSRETEVSTDSTW